MEAIKGLGVIDFIFIILWLKITYTAISRGFRIEIIKILGLLVGALLAFHLYPSLAAILSKKLSFLNKTSFNVLSFVFILAGVIAAFSLFARLVKLFRKKEEMPFEEKLIAMFAGWLRCAFLVSLVIFCLHLSPLNSKYFKHSFSYRLFKKIAPKTYLISIEVCTKFNHNIKLNKEVKNYYETREDLS